MTVKKKKREYIRLCKTCSGRREVTRAYGQRFPCPRCNKVKSPSQTGSLPAPTHDGGVTISGGK